MSRAPAPLPQALRPLTDLGTPEAPPRRPDLARRREDLLAAAVRLFGERGFRGVTTDHLGAAAGVSPSTLYSLVRDKQHCLLAAYEAVLEGARVRLVDRIAPRASAPERIEAAIAGVLEEIAADPLAARLVLLVAPTAGAEGAARHRRTLAEAAAALRGAWGPQGGEEPPEGLADVVVAGAAFLLLASLLDPPRPSGSLPAELRALLLPRGARAEEARAPVLSAVGDPPR